jgi:hypothetical protein
MLGRFCCMARLPAAPAAAPAIGAAGAGWAAWRFIGVIGAGAGAGIWRTVCDWRPIERRPPIGRAIASLSIAVAVSASTIVTRNFFMHAPCVKCDPTV